jgi:hypothetical protein
MRGQPAPTFPPGQRKKSTEVISGKSVGWPIVFLPLPPIEVPVLNGGIVWVFVLAQNQSWNDNMRHFGFENRRGLILNLLVFPGLMVSLPGFLNSGGNSDNEVGGPFCHLGHFLSFTALMRNVLDSMTFSFPCRRSPPTI